MHEQRMAKDETMAGRVQGLLRMDAVTDATKAKAAAVESRHRSAATVLGKRSREPDDGYIEMGHVISRDKINDWVTNKKSGLNAKQLEVLDLVANRIMVEFRLAPNPRVRQLAILWCGSCRVHQEQAS
eukprot:6486781-Amphidinium_carterae.1